MNYPVHRTPERGHTVLCLAKAMINAVENFRDMIISDHRTVGLNPDFADHEFRLGLQDNLPLQWADEYLKEGVTECLCPVIITGNHQASCDITRGGACDCAFKEAS